MKNQQNVPMLKKCKTLLWPYKFEKSQTLKGLHLLHDVRDIK